MNKRNLHIGGKKRSEGWEIVDIIPGPDVDHVADAQNLHIFPDNTFTTVYASHVLEHFSFVGEVLSALKEWYRILEPNGLLCISVPDLELLAGLFLKRDEFDFEERFKIMQMIFGGHKNRYDVHHTGFSEEYLDRYLHLAGFQNIRRIDDFGLFDDSSCLVVKGYRISLNMIARKLADL